MGHGSAPQAVIPVGDGAHAPGVVAVATLLAVSALGVASAACGSPSPRATFDREVAPVLERRCASPVCHGVPIGSDDELAVDWSRLFYRVDGEGHLADLGQAYVATKRVIQTREDAAFSSLLRKPLPRAYGGLAHVGGANFASPEDGAYRTLRAWIVRESGGGEDAEPLNQLEARFAAEVEPGLVSAGCLSGNCHGLESAVPFRLDPGYGGRFPTAASRANHRAARRMLALDGDPSMSRLLRKGLPLHRGGIAHRGGNTAFFTGPDDPRAVSVRAWACAEREAAVGAPCLAPRAAPIRGVVFVRGPLAPGDPFDLDVFAPGSDLHFARVDGPALAPVEITNLTASLHDGPADVRDPAVDPSGEKVLFAMRLGADEGHNLWELTLATGEARALTRDAGPTADGGFVTYRDPTYGPHGHVWFVSTRAGTLADGDALLDADLYEVDLASEVLTRRTFTPHVERKPVFLVHGEENGGEVSFTALRAAVPAQRRAHPFRFPPGLATEYHQHFGIVPPEDLFFDLRELPDGRYVVTVGDLTGVWEAGRLGVVDRNFGPELPAGATAADAAMGGYLPPLARLDPTATSRGVTGALYRDAVALPDGRLLVAHAEGEVDLADPGAAPDLGIRVLTLREALDGSGPRIASLGTVVDAPGVADYDPEPVYARETPPDDEPVAWDPEARTGLLLHNGLPLIEAILGALPPLGEKPVRGDLRYVRLVEPLPRGAGDRDAPATLTALSPSRVLGEWPLAEDGTFQVELPAGVPFRVQGLDEDRRAVGTMHNRWFYVAPGQRLVMGAPVASYAAQCGACHGALDGEKAHAVAAPDVVTSASVNLSRYVQRDPRRPIAPPLAGDATRVEVDFTRDVQPILDRACAVGPCHRGDAPAAGLSLEGTRTARFSVAYEALLGEGPGAMAYVDVLGRGAAESPLFGFLADHPAVGAAAPALTDEELLTLARWADLGAAFVGTSAGGDE